MILNKRLQVIEIQSITPYYSPQIYIIPTTLQTIKQTLTHLIIGFLYCRVSHRIAFALAFCHRSVKRRMRGGRESYVRFRVKPLFQVLKLRLYSDG